MKLTELKPIVREKALQLIEKCKVAGINLIVTSTYRSIDEQNELYAKGRTKPGNIVTNARGGQSFHNWRVAFDVVEVRNGVANWNCDWNKIGAIGESCGLEWGGRWKEFKDNPHFQYTAGYTLKDFQDGKISEDKFLTNELLKDKISYLKGMLAELLAKLSKSK